MLQVAECAVVRVADTIKGEVPVAIAVLKSGVELGKKQICSEIAIMVRRFLSSFFSSYPFHQSILPLISSVPHP